jgi:hypothetical protein
VIGLDRDAVATGFCGEDETMTKPIDGAAALGLPMEKNEAGAATIREYLKAILLGVWTRGADFDGKRPFGSSSWQCDIYVALIKADVVEGSLDGDGFVATVDEDAADAIVKSAIEAMTAER